MEPASSSKARATGGPGPNAHCPSSPAHRSLLGVTLAAVEEKESKGE